MTAAPRLHLALALAALALTGCALCGADEPERPPPDPAFTLEKAMAFDAGAAPKPVSALRPPVIDVHTHIGSRAYPLAFKIADANGIACLVNLSGGNQSSPKAFARHLQALETYKGRLAVFYNLDWERVNEEGFGASSAEGLEDAVNKGYGGLKISKALGLGVTDADGELLAVDDPRLDPIWAKAGALGVPVSIHTSDPKAFFEPVTEENERFEELSAAPSWSFADPAYPRRDALLAARNRVLAKHPETTFILVHFANNPEDLSDVERVLETYPNAVVDVSARLAEIGRHPPEVVYSLFKRHSGRILFGTDMGVRVKRRGDQLFYSLFLGSISKEPPKMDDVGVFLDRHFTFFEERAADTGPIDHPVPIQGRWKIQPIGLEGEVLEAVYHQNARRLIFTPRSSPKAVPKAP